jgi:hypothetical protein
LPPYPGYGPGGPRADNAIPDWPWTFEEHELDVLDWATWVLLEALVGLSEPRDLISVLPEPMTGLTAGYLGLILDKPGGEIRRDGFPSVRLTRTRLWSILEVLMSKGTQFADEKAIQDAWPDSEMPPERSTIRDALSELRRVLRPLGIVIANERGFGWRLADG